MILWTEPALEDMDKIAEFIFDRTGYDESGKVLALIAAHATTIVEPMNSSRPGRVANTRELLIPYKKRSQYFVVFKQDAVGNFLMLRVKHALEQYP